MRCRIAALFIALLAAAFLPAQAQQPGQRAYVDTRDECRTLGGAWLMRDGWQGQCQTPWGRDECLRLGGGWTPMSAAPNGGVCVAQVSAGGAAAQCRSAGGTWGPPGSSMPFCTVGTTPARGATVRAAADANKPCDSQRDCTYGCVYDGPAKQPGADVMGRCRADNAPGKCYQMVDKGRLAGEFCIK